MLKAVAWGNNPRGVCVCVCFFLGCVALPLWASNQRSRESQASSAPKPGDKCNWGLCEHKSQLLTDLGPFAADFEAKLGKVQTQGVRLGISMAMQVWPTWVLQNVCLVCTRLPLTSRMLSQKRCVTTSARHRHALETIGQR